MESDALDLIMRDKFKTFLFWKKSILIHLTLCFITLDRIIDWRNLWKNKLKKPEKFQEENATTIQIRK
jgi:hypothetical protein